MIGIQHLEALRHRRIIPSNGVVVWCSELPLKRCTLRAPFSDPRETAEIVIGSDDNPARLDLRALVGLPVVVCGADPNRREQVAKAVWSAGASGAITDQHGAYIGSIEEAADHG